VTAGGVEDEVAAERAAEDVPVEAEEVESEDEVEEEVAVTEPRRVVMMAEEGQPMASGCIDRKVKP
jgi:hypothetical protein